MWPGHVCKIKLVFVILSPHQQQHHKHNHQNYHHHHHLHHHHHQENVSDPSTIPTDSLLVQTMASCHSLIKVVFQAISIIYLTE